jgi:hypothetical protein
MTMLKILLFTLGVIFAATSWQSRISAAELVALCHHPLGNPDNHQMIVVDAAAVPPHLAHGDHLHAMCPAHDH